MITCPEGDRFDLSKYVCKDVGTDPSDPDKQRNQTKQFRNEVSNELTEIYSIFRTLLLTTASRRLPGGETGLMLCSGGILASVLPHKESLNLEGSVGSSVNSDF